MPPCLLLTAAPIVLGRLFSAHRPHPTAWQAPHDAAYCAGCSAAWTDAVASSAAAVISTNFMTFTFIFSPSNPA